MGEVVEVSAEECLKARAGILDRFPQLRDWAPACEVCRSPNCAVNLAGFTVEERKALQSLHTISYLLGGEVDHG